MGGKWAPLGAPGRLANTSTTPGEPVDAYASAAACSADVFEDLWKTLPGAVGNSDIPRIGEYQ